MNLASGVASAPRFPAKPVCDIMKQPSLPARRPYAGRGRVGARSARRRTRTGRLEFRFIVTFNYPGGTTVTVAERVIPLAVSAAVMV